MFAEEAMRFLLIFLIAANTVFACFAGFTAGAKGRNKSGWFFITLIFGPLALFSLAQIPVAQDVLNAKKVRRNIMRWCPVCLRAIDARATKCCYCLSSVDPTQSNKGNYI